MRIEHRRFTLRRTPSPLTVIFIEVVIFNDRYQTVGIRRIGGISGLFQTTRPPLIIGYLQFKKECIAGSALQECRMVLVRVAGIAVRTKTLVTGIVVMTNGTPIPIAATLDVEVIITFTSQRTHARTTLKQSLSQCDTGRYLMLFHLLHGQGTILIYIIYVTGIPALRLGTCSKSKDCNYGNQPEEFAIHLLFVYLKLCGTKIIKIIGIINLFSNFVT